MCHHPPGTSKWNEIERRLFSYITEKWRRRLLLDMATIAQLITGTTTDTGLTVHATYDDTWYETGIKITDTELAELHLWNDTIVHRPRDLTCGAPLRFRFGKVSIMTATYTWDVFSTLDGYGSYGADGDWGGYWSKQGPELLEHRAALFDTDQRMVFGATTFRENAQIMIAGNDPNTLDEWNVRTMRMPATVISSTLHDTLGWPDATIVSGDATDIVTRLKEESDVPLRSQASLSLNWALMAAGLVDRVQVTIFPVISGLTGTSPILGGATDFDLELLDSRTLDGHTQELVYRPSLH